MRSPLVTQMKRTSLLGPVAQDLLHASLVVDGDVHAARAPEDVVELQAGLADGRVVDDRQEAGGIRHQGAVEQRLVLVEQPDQVDVAIEIGGLVSELLKDAPQLHVLVLDDIRQQTSQAQRLALGECERRGFVEAAIVEEVHPTLAERNAGHVRGRIAGHCFSHNLAPDKSRIGTFVSPSRLSSSAFPVEMCARTECDVNCRRRAGCRGRVLVGRGLVGRQRKLATRLACSAMTRALSSSGVPAASPLTLISGLDHTGMRGQPPQLSL